MSTYARRGEIAAKVIAHLKTLPADQAISMRQACEVAGEDDIRGVSRALNFALSDGRLRNIAPIGLPSRYVLGAGKAAPKRKVYSIGWPEGYGTPGVSPYDTVTRGVTDGQRAREKVWGAAAVEQMRAGGLALPSATNPLGVLSRDQAGADKRDAIRRGGV